MKNAYQDENLNILYKEAYVDSKENDIGEYKYVNEACREHEG